MDFETIMGQTESLENESDEDLLFGRAVANLLTWGARALVVSCGVAGLAVGAEMAESVGENQILTAGRSALLVATGSYAVASACLSVRARRGRQAIEAELIARQQRSNTVE